MPTTHARNASEAALATVHQPGLMRSAPRWREMSRLVKGVVSSYMAHCDRTLGPRNAAEWRRIFKHDYCREDSSQSPKSRNPTLSIW
jgi:hypothetical protein